MSTKTIGLSKTIELNRNWFSNAIKRAFDIVVSAIVLVILAPFFGFIAIAIHRDSPGPVFFRGNRMGYKGRPFKILKFRTMFEEPKSYAGPVVTAQDDPRITPLGRWLRDTKLNELPQFWNVLIGEMSLVGPRPEDPSIARTWPKKVWEEVLSVRPGITSPATVQYHNEEALLTFGVVLQKYFQELKPDKMRLDQLYVRYRSFWLDLDVLLWTALILIPKIGSTTLPEKVLFLGPINRLVHRYLNWFTIDFLVTFVSLGLAGVIWRVNAPLDVGWPKAIAIALGSAFLFSATGAALGVNRIAWSKASFSDVYELIPAWLIASAISFLVNRWLGLFPWELVAAASVFAISGFILARYRSRLVTALLVWVLRYTASSLTTRERVLIVGSGRTAENIARLLDHPTYARSFQVVGFVDDELLARGMRIYGAEILGTCEELPQLAEKHDVDLILLADHRLNYQKYVTILKSCSGLPLKVISVPDIFGALNGLSGVTYENLPDEEECQNRSEYRCQRCLARIGSAGMEIEEDNYEI